MGRSTSWAGMGRLVIRRQERSFSTWPQGTTRPLGQGKASAPFFPHPKPPWAWLFPGKAHKAGPGSGHRWQQGGWGDATVGCTPSTHSTLTHAHAQHTPACHGHPCSHALVPEHAGCGHRAVARVPSTSHPGLRSSSSFHGSVADAASQHPACGSDVRPHRRCCWKVLSSRVPAATSFSLRGTHNRPRLLWNTCSLCPTDPGNFSLEPRAPKCK